MTSRRRAAPAPHDRAFTLVELLVVVSIIALLISILLPSLKKARNQAKDAQCRSNLHQLGVAIHYYMPDNNDRLPWIKGTRVGGNTAYTNFPFRQYHQILHFHKYIKNLDIYTCPRANAGQIGGRGGLRGPPTVKAYKEGTQISYYTVQTQDDLFKKIKGEFPGTRVVNDVAVDLYSEYWFNDWNKGAGGGAIPAVSGNILSHIPHPNHAVMMADAIDWSPRHDRANFFMFVDAHVERIAAENYFDPDGSGTGYATARDKDAFGNRPFYAWGIGEAKNPVNGDP